MPTCTFFGHRDIQNIDKEKLKNEIINLIENHNVDYFLVGNNGFLDSTVKCILFELLEKYEIDFNIVLAYLPRDNYPLEKSILPENFENFPIKFAIDRRNEYMLKKADFVICYITHNFGGAAKFVQKAISRKKKVINIADL